MYAINKKFHTYICKFVIICLFIPTLKQNLNEEITDKRNLKNDYHQNNFKDTVIDSVE